MKRAVMRIWKAWTRFWFESFSPVQLKVFRVALAVVMLGFYLVRSLDLREIYSQRTGVFPLAELDGLIRGDYRFSILSYLPWDWMLILANGVFLAAIVGLAIGFRPRLMAVVTLVLHVSILHVNMSANYGVDLIFTYFLLSLCFAQYEMPRDEADGKSFRQMASSIAFRFAQLQVCIIYGYSGMEKLRGMQWWKGEALWDVLANGQIARFDLSWFAHFPLLIVAMTYSTLLWELYFPVLVWLPKLRRWFLLFGVLMHIGIGILMSLPFFAALMVSTYILFLDPKSLDTTSRVLDRVFIRLSFLKRVVSAA